MTAQELVTILWSLSQLHHQPGPEWLAVFFEACEPHLSSLPGGQLAQLGYSLGQLGCEPPKQWMDMFLAQVRPHKPGCLAGFSSSMV